jgi:hypothetical protein
MLLQWVLPNLIGLVLILELLLVLIDLLLTIDLGSAARLSLSSDLIPVDLRELLRLSEVLVGLLRVDLRPEELRVLLVLSGKPGLVSLLLRLDLRLHRHLLQLELLVLRLHLLLGSKVRHRVHLRELHLLRLLGSLHPELVLPLPELIQPFVVLPLPADERGTADCCGRGLKADVNCHILFA